MRNEIIEILKHMPYDVYANKYFKDKQYNSKRDYYRWDYDTQLTYYNYLIKLFESNNKIFVYMYRADKVLPTKKGPKVIINTLKNIIAYFRIIGFKVETYD